MKAAIAILHCDLPRKNWHAKYMQDFTYKHLPDYDINYELIFHLDPLPGEKDIDIIDISEWCSAWQQEIALSYSIPIVCTTEEGSLNSLRNYLSENKINVEFMLKRISHFIARTSWTRDMLMFFGISGDKISVIPYGADLDTFKPANKKSEELAFIYVGSINKQKGVDILLNSYLQIENQTDWKLKLVVGEFNNDEELLNELKLLAWKHEKIELVSFPSSINKLAEYYHEASCFCHIQSHNNPLQFGTPFLWAISCGLPAISLDLGAARDYIKNEENGFLCRRYEEIPDKMLKITKMGVEIEEMEEASINIAEEKFNPEKIAKKYKEVYDEILQK